MSNDLETYLRDPAPESDGSYTGVLRQALHEVSRFAPTVVEPLAAQIESAYQTARQEAQEQFEREKARLTGDLQSHSQKTQQGYEAELQAAQSDFESRLSALKVEIQQKRKKVMEAAAELESKAQKERQDQIMVAEFVAEGAATRKQQKTLKAKTTAEEVRRRLVDLGEQAEQLVRLYRYHCPAPEPSSTGGDSDYNPSEVLRVQQALAEQHLDALRRLYVAQLFVGARPILFAGGLFGAAVALLTLLYLLQVPGLPSARVTTPAAVALVGVIIGLGGRALWHRGQRQVRQVHHDFRKALASALAARAQQLARALQDIEQEWQAAVEQKQAELKRAQTTFETSVTNITRQRNTSFHQLEEQGRQTADGLRNTRDQTIREAEQKYQQQQSALESQLQRDLAARRQRYEEEMSTCESRYRAARKSLEDRWDQGLARLETLLQYTDRLDREAAGDWGHLEGDSWTPPRTPAAGARFGTIEMDLGSLAPAVAARAKSLAGAVKHMAVPALLELPAHGSLLLEYPREGRPLAIETLRAVMMRLFTSFPPGQVRFTILDPVGLGESFAGFMHAGDYLEGLVGSRIWTEPGQVQEQLEDLSQHMENVIQKYLRNEFETIEQYNQQAGELAEPYRFLVIADFPRNFNEDTARRLSSIIHSGPRCGVHTLIARDIRAELPSGVDLKDLAANSVHLAYQDGRFVWQDRVLQPFPLVLDQPPGEAAVTKTMHIVGKAAAASARVEVPFTAIAPAENQYWSLDSREELRIPLGRTGATRLQYLTLGRGVAQHLLIAGKTGSGKSTLLHVMITNLALWYAPDQVELYLIDFKQGVEFKTYATHRLPHARAVAIESEREFGLSILQRLDAEMVRRGDLFRDAGVQDVGAYRKATGKSLPRTVLIVDEFQIFFAEDDKLAQDAAVLLEQLVRQGRAFGIHVVLGSQTLGGVFGLARSTIGQMAIRIALQCSEADSQLILDDDNVAARRLSRPGEAIYNDVGGATAGNNPFQTAWLPDSVRDSYLAQIEARPYRPPDAREPLIVFEGSAPAEIADNRQLATYLAMRNPAPPQTPKLWLGAPVTIKEPTAVTLRRQSGANVLIVGQREEAAMSLMGAALVSLAAQLPASSSEFVILDPGSSDAPGANIFDRLAAVIPHGCHKVSWGDVAKAIAQLAHETGRRAAADRRTLSTVLLLIPGLQRYRMLRRREDTFGLSLEDDAKERPDTLFADLLREGPHVGIHVMAWADTLSTLERTLDRQTIREFDHRVLFQMSVGDSSNLIDSPVANQLGLHRALLYSEEQGRLERFRPYGALPEDWLSDFGEKLSHRSRPA